MDIKRIVTLIAVSALLTACREERPGKLGASRGGACELLVVCSPEVMRGDVMDSVRSVTQADAPGLGSAENIFRVTSIGAGGYDAAFFAMHSKVFFLIEKGVEASVGVAYDVKVRPEIEVVVKAPTLAAMRELISEKRELVQGLIVDFQVQRLASLAQRRYSRRVSDELRAVSGHTVKMPTDMVATKRGADFLWGGSNRERQDVNFLYYSYPWDGGDLTDIFVPKRDSVLRRNVPGARDDQYMTTSRGEGDVPVIWPRWRKLGSEGIVLEVRGLWELKNGFMGGPFVALASIDSVAKKVTVREGFVFNPEGQKRDLMRQLEGALRTFE